MAKRRVDNHLKENASEALVAKLLPEEWVIRKLHPDYGVDVSVEVFERQGQHIPTMGEFLFVQIKSTTSLRYGIEPIRPRGNVEKGFDTYDKRAAHELDVVRYVVDTDTMDNARLMGPSTPLMLFVCDLTGSEIYYICLTDYYEKIIEPRGVDLGEQGTFTVLIPTANKLTDPRSVQVMRFYATRAKLYGMFNLAQFQNREAQGILEEFQSQEHLATLPRNFAMIERFARRLRAMPVWQRDIPWLHFAWDRRLRQRRRRRRRRPHAADSVPQPLLTIMGAVFSHRTHIRRHCPRMVPAHMDWTTRERRGVPFP